MYPSFFDELQKIGEDVETPGHDPSDISGSEQHITKQRKLLANRSPAKDKGSPAGETLGNLSAEIDQANSNPTLGG